MLVCAIWVAPALRDRVLGGLRSEIVTVVDQLIDDLPDEGLVDLAADFADPLPARLFRADVWNSL